MACSIVPVVAVAFLYVSLAAAGALAKSGLYTTFHNYDPPANQYDFIKAGLFCATWDANKPLSWRKKHLWTAYFKATKSNCGRCMKVSNPKTGESVTVRIVDHSSNGGLDLEPKAFKALDSDGAGYFNGHIHLRAQWTSC